MRRRVAITGSRGFIGTHVTAALRAHGDEVVPIARPFVLADLRKTFERTDAVVHLAGVVSAVHERDYYEGNVEFTRIVAHAAEEARIRMVHISSLAAAGPAPASAPRSEDDQPSPITTYGRSKLEGERAVRDRRDLRWTILRPGVVYGPGDRALEPLFRMARAGWLPLVGDPLAAYTFIYIDDATRAILAALERTGSGDILFLGHAIPVTARDLLEAVRDTVRPDGRIVPIPRIVARTAALAGDVATFLARRPAMINSRRFAELYSAGFVCRVDRMVERLGVSAEVGLREGLTRARGWYEGH